MKHKLQAFTAYRCTCGQMTLGGTKASIFAAHARHVAEVREAESAPETDVASQGDELEPEPAEPEAPPADN